MCSFSDGFLRCHDCLHDRFMKRYLGLPESLMITGFNSTPRSPFDIASENTSFSDAVGKKYLWLASMFKSEENKPLKVWLTSEYKE